MRIVQYDELKLRNSKRDNFTLNIFYFQDARLFMFRYHPSAFDHKELQWSERFYLMLTSLLKKVNKVLRL